MSVYNLNFNEEFIKELPVDWNKWKNMDLSQVPEKYHKCFTTDWNWGKYSTMNWKERIKTHSLWLEYNNGEILANKKISQPVVPELLTEDFRDDKDSHKNGFIRF